MIIYLLVISNLSVRLSKFSIFSFEELVEMFLDLLGLLAFLRGLSCLRRGYLPSFVLLCLRELRIFSSIFIWVRERRKRELLVIFLRSW